MPRGPRKRVSSSYFEDMAISAHEILQEHNCAIKGCPRGADEGAFCTEHAKILRERIHTREYDNFVALMELLLKHKGRICPVATVRSVV